MGTTLPQLGHRRTGSSRSTRYRIAASRPMNGGIAAITNHSRNELPFIRPMTPPARPKKKQMTRNAIARGSLGPRSEERPHRPDDRDDREHDGDEEGHARDHADHDLEQEPGRDRQHEDREDAGADGGRRRFVHTLQSTASAPAARRR